MKNYIITVEEVRNDEGGFCVERPLVKIGNLCAPTKWDALKKARILCKAEARNCYLYDTETMWMHELGGVTVLRKEFTCLAHELQGIRVRLYETKRGVDGVEWGLVE